MKQGLDEQQVDAFIADENKAKQVEKERWIAAVLANDESSTDEELVEYFITEGSMTREEAQELVKCRDEYLRM